MKFSIVDNIGRTIGTNHPEVEIEDLPEVLGGEYDEYDEKLSDLLDSYVNGMSVWDETRSSCFNDFLTYDEAYEAISAEYKDKLFVLYDDEENEVAVYKADEALNILLENIYPEDEANEIATGDLWSHQLQNFIEKAEWHVALTDGDEILLDVSEWPKASIKNGNISWNIKDKEGKKIKLTLLVWFGIEGDNPYEDEYWILESNGMEAIVTKENGMGSYGRQQIVDGLEINYNLLYDGCTYWYFGCGGNEGADFQKVVDSCPVNLHDLYYSKSVKDNERLIAQAVLDYQQNVLQAELK